MRERTSKLTVQIFIHARIHDFVNKSKVQLIKG